MSDIPAVEHPSVCATHKKFHRYAEKYSFVFDTRIFFVNNKSTGQTQPRRKASSGIGYNAQRFALYTLIKRLQSALISFITTYEVRYPLRTNKFINY